MNQFLNYSIILNGKIFLTLFENVRFERMLILALSLTDEGILNQVGFTENEIKIIKDIALQKVHRQRSLKKYKAIEILDNK